MKASIATVTPAFFHGPDGARLHRTGVSSRRPAGRCPHDRCRSILVRERFESLLRTGIVAASLLTVRHGKGGRDRVVQLSTIACRFLAHYVQYARPRLLNGTPTDRLFLSSQGPRLGATTVNELIRKATARAGLRTHVTCHQWRYMCATHMLQNGANLRHVQELLGHQKLETTQRYLHLTILDLKRAHHRFHPREMDVARRRATRHNAGCEAENAIAKDSPADAENRHILSQPTPPTTRPDKEIPIA